MTDFQTAYQQYKELVDRALANYFDVPDAPHHVLLDSMRYSLNAAGAGVLSGMRRRYSCRAPGSLRNRNGSHLFADPR